METFIRDAVRNMRFKYRTSIMKSKHPLYQALDRYQIRLLKVHPQTRNGLVTCSMKIKDVYEARYIALSYCWGDASDPQTLSVNGHLIQVAKNLWDFLQYARTNFASCNFWIDAVCINQADSYEKRDQVDRMALVYLKAIEVYAWFGSSDTQNPSSNCTIEADDVKVKNLLDENVMARWRECGVQKDLVQVLKRIFLDRYWTRIWVIQEFILAEDIKIITGSFELDLFSLRYILGQMNHGVGHGPDVFIPYANVATAEHIQALFRSHDSRREDRRHQGRLHELIQQHLHCECQDPRDRVFGLLSLATWEGWPEAPLRADYTRDVFELYILTFRHLWNDYGFRRSLHAIDEVWILLDFAITLMKALHISLDDLMRERSTVEFVCMFSDGPSSIERSAISQERSVDLSEPVADPLRCACCDGFLPQPTPRRLEGIILCISELLRAQEIHLMFVASPTSSETEAYLLQSHFVRFREPPRFRNTERSRFFPPEWKHWPWRNRMF